MGLLTSKKKKLADIVIDEIKRMILEGELKEGDKLPNQNMFSEQLGVSRPSLREALHTLTLMGVIEQKPGAGTILKSDKTDLWEQSPPPPLLSDSRATLELIEARKELETLMIRLTVERITDEEINEIDGIIQRMKVSIENEDIGEYLKEDVKFHYHLANASANRYMIHMFVTIRNLMEEFMEETFSVLPRLGPDSYEAHVAIFEAVKKRDKKKAMKEVAGHIAHIEEGLRSYYAAQKNTEQT